MDIASRCPWHTSNSRPGARGSVRALTLISLKVGRAKLPLSRIYETSGLGFPAYFFAPTPFRGRMFLSAVHPGSGDPGLTCCTPIRGCGPTTIFRIPITITHIASRCPSRPTPQARATDVATPRQCFNTDLEAITDIASRSPCHTSNGRPGTFPAPQFNQARQHVALA